MTQFYSAFFFYFGQGSVPQPEEGDPLPLPPLPGGRRALRALRVYSPARTCWRDIDATATLPYLSLGILFVLLSRLDVYYLETENPFSWLL